MLSSLPDPHQLEVSVFGPGIGECTVAHIGDGDWIVVDSCLDKDTKEPIALEYLKFLKVDISTRVKLVVATHWHDDHIKGIGKILHAAKSAKFVDSAAYKATQLAGVVGLGSQTAANASATEEYRSIYQVLTQRRKDGESTAAVGPIHAIADKKLLSLLDPARTVRAEVTALSPSDGTFSRAEAELAHAFSLLKDRKRPSTQGPNQLCVVLWLQIGVLQVMLGADLEHVAGVTEGWKAITRSDVRPEGRAGIFKVPHHGSKNAHCSECWDELLSTQPISIVTPYSPSKLPKKEDFDRLCKQTQQLFLTSDYARYKSPRLNHTVERTLREGGIKRRPLEGRMGHVRVRVDARDLNQVPKIELFDGAEQKCA